MSVDVFDLKGVLSIDIKPYEDGLKKAQNMSRSFSQKAGREIGKAAGDGMDNAAKRTSTVATKLKSGFSKAAKVAGVAFAGATAAAGAFAKSAISDSISYESAFAGVMKTVDETATTSYDDISNAIKQMATETASSQEEIAGVAEVAGQLGVSADDISKFTKTIVELGDTTNLEAEEAAMALAQFNNITGEGNENIDRIGASIVDLGNNFATTERDIVNMAQRLAGAGKMFNISSQDILGISTAMASVGIKAEAGGTAMTQILTKIDKAANGVGKKATPILKSLADTAGMSADQFAKNWKEKPTEAFTAFLKGVEKVKGEGGNVVALLDSIGVTGIREADTMKRLVGSSDLFTRALQTSNSAYEKNIALNKEAETRYGTTQSKMNQMQASIKNLKLALVEGLSPAFQSATDSGVNAIKSLTEAFQSGGMDGFMTKLGDVFTSAISKLVEKLPKAIDAGSKLLLSLIEGITKSIPQLAKAAVQIVDGLVDALLKAVPDIIQAGYDLMIEFADGITEAIPKILPKITDLIISIANKIVQNAPKIITAAVRLFVALAKGIVKAIPKIVKALPELIKALVDGILDAIPQIIDAGVDLLTSLVTDLPNIINTIVEAIPQIITGIIDSLLDHIDDIIDAGFKLITSLFDNLPKIIGTIITAIPKIIKGIFKALTDPKNLKKILVAGFKIAVKIVEGILSFIVKLPGKILQFIKGIGKAFKEGWDKLVEIGGKVISGIWEGMKAIWNQVKEWAIAAVNWFIKLWEKAANAMKKAKGWVEDKVPQALEQAGYKNVGGNTYQSGLTRIWYDKDNGRIVDLKTGKELDSIPKKMSARRIRNAEYAETRLADEEKSGNRRVLEKLDEIGDKITSAVEDSGDTTIVLNDREFGRAVRNVYA